MQIIPVILLRASVKAKVPDYHFMQTGHREASGGRDPYRQRLR